MNTHLDVAISLLVDPADPHRLGMDHARLVELAQDIKENGLINPLCVRAIGGGQFEVVAGHRRLAALRMIGALNARCAVLNLSDEKYEQIKFAENLQRSDLTPMEEALAVSRLMMSTGCSEGEVAKKLHRSGTWVHRRVELMLLPDDLKEAVHLGQMATASALLLAEIADEHHRRYLLAYALSSGASTQVLREWVSQWKLARDAGNAGDAPLPDMGSPAQAAIVQMPCFTCGEVHNHLELQIVRLCKGCATEIFNSTVAS